MVTHIGNVTNVKSTNVWIEPNNWMSWLGFNRAKFGTDFIHLHRHYRNAHKVNPLTSRMEWLVNLVKPGLAASRAMHQFVRSQYAVMAAIHWDPIDTQTRDSVTSHLVLARRSNVIICHQRLLAIKVWLQGSHLTPVTFFLFSFANCLQFGATWREKKREGRQSGTWKGRKKRDGRCRCHGNPPSHRQTWNSCCDLQWWSAFFFPLLFVLVKQTSSQPDRRRWRETLSARGGRTKRLFLLL